MSPNVEIPSGERCDRERLVAQQAARLRQLLADIYGRNRFYTRKLDLAGIHPDGLRLPDDLATLPLTTKAELVADQRAHPPWGTVLTEPIEHYTRYSQTSSTTDRPLRWLDTNESWQWMVDCWKAVYRGARVAKGHRVFFPFSFGPFLGFWTAFDAASQLGALAVPGGGMSSQLRLAIIEAVSAEVVCCTPTYALRLAEAAAEEPNGPRLLSERSVGVLIVAGEPGGNIPATRRRIEEGWGARVIDHYGLTEVGPMAFECWDAPGFMHLNEGEYICEVIDPSTGRAVADGVMGELVVTNLGRAASPVIRYRTGDLVIRQSAPCACGRTSARLEGGVLARTDDMVSIRGVNVYPAAIEAAVRRVREIREFRSTVSDDGAMRSLSLEIEIASSAGDEAAVISRVSRALREALGLTVAIRRVEPGALPRFEMKARRFTKASSRD